MRNNYLKTFNSKKEFMEYLSQQTAFDEPEKEPQEVEPTEKDLEEIEHENGREEQTNS